GLGIADALYSSLAAFGLSAVAELLVGQQRWLGLGGGLFLCYLGLTTLRAPLADPGPAVPRLRGLLTTYPTMLPLTLATPPPILSSPAIFAGLGLGAASQTATVAPLLVAGVFLGSISWWLVLASATVVLRRRLTPERLRWTNRVSGLVLGG